LKSWLSELGCDRLGYDEFEMPGLPSGKSNHESNIVHGQSKQRGRFRDIGGITEF
jgi:hypothetical protein